MDKKIMQEAVQIRKDNFGNRVTFCYPKKTRPVSVTGKDCSLNCSHCNKKYLDNMHTVDSLDDTPENVTSFLVSGGCDENGKVPITEEHFEVFNKTGRKLNVHCGLVDEKEAEIIGKYADTVSFDFVYDDKTIKDVYGLKKTKEDYEKTLLFLDMHTKVIPHICIGLHEGKVDAEIETLLHLKEILPDLDELTFIILKPTKGTDYENVMPPSEEDVAEIFCSARKLFPRAHINLGCMKPKGSDYDYNILALRCGLNKVVLPGKNAEEFAEKQDLKIKKTEECCVLSD